MKYWEWTSNTDDFASYYPDEPVCKHEWKGTWLIRTQVFDCQLCGAKKEEVENEVQRG